MSSFDAITLRQLRALVAVADCGSITAAAARLRLSPPAVHSQIRTLEQVYGAALVTRARDPGQTRLTPAGEAVLETAREVARLLGQSAGQVTARAQGMAGRATLGLVTAGAALAPRLLGLLRDRCPDIEVTLRVANRAGTLDALGGRGIDLALMGPPLQGAAMASRPLGPHPHGIVAASDHPLARRAAVTAADLSGQTLLVREEGSGTRLVMQRYLDALGVAAVVRLIEAGSNETIAQAAGAGLGLGFLSLHAVWREIGRGDLVALRGPGLPVRQDWCLVHPLAAPLTPAAQGLHDAIAAFGDSLLPA